jgi:anti-sigma B factor antagonist
VTHGSEGIAVVPMPDEIDIANAERLAADLDSEIKPGVRIVIVDMTLTTFCDSSGLRLIAQAQKRAKAGNVELRLVVSAPQVLRILAVSNLDSVVPVYSRLTAALQEETHRCSRSVSE